ncbi:unnamed protein product [Plasmodium vivax]|uniref:(malaria parasite P. vivax) hypothetical protein n=1 Tax=Plasmodium vivax TaxID=5855 RepID=A0A8S4H5X4_PLAVI|nr:unnamed protein product [Plasmodium vivax]
MSEPCDGHNGQYFKYHCYIRLRDYFDIKRETDRDTGILKEYRESSQKNKEFVKKYDKLFERLTNRFGGDGLFISPGPYVCCPYLNFWLNHTIAYKHHDLRGKDFQVFKEFADFYAKKRTHTSYEKNSCKKYIKPLYDDNYNIMQILYKMYELYNLNTRWDASYGDNSSKICTNYSLINRHYKYLKETYKGDKDLNEKLDDFINVINNSKNSVKAVCKYEILPPVSRLEDSKLVLDPDSRDKQMLGSTDESVSHPSEVSEHSVTQRAPGSHLQVLAESEVAEPHEVESHTEKTDQSGSRALQSEEVESPKVELLDLALQKGLEKLTSESTLPPGSSELRYLNEDRFGEVRERRDGEKGNPSYDLLNTEFGYPNTREKLSTTVSDPKGFFSNVQDTFFSIVKDVEPGPVLGVSGGMGVLFILFKYTPFGSLFGGRRGRFHQIPSSFRGLSPGEFPNFHEYEGGHIGYGAMNMPHLAE